MDSTNRNTALASALAEELARCGVRQAVISPGSRSTPLALALWREPAIDATVILDERSAGYFALGAAQATRTPVATLCTSGTAAANLHPAVCEADESAVPLIVMTADRPPELREVGAGQAIDQIKLYGSFAKWFVEVGSHEPGRETAIHHRQLACRAWATAAEGRPGPVHLNFPLREPLAPLREELAAGDWAGREDGSPWVSVTGLPPDGEGILLAHDYGDTARGAIVCGAGAADAVTEITGLAAATGWPVLADPLSGVRCGDHDRSHVIAHYDVLLRHEGWAERHRPAVVVRVGDTPTSKPLRAWLATARQVVVDPHGAWHEPTRRAETVLRAPNGPALEALMGFAGPGDPDWLRSWRAADDLVPTELAAIPEPFEPKALAALAGAPAGTTLWVSSSMPIRDVESFFPSTATPLRFLANRGANGIDGVTSSALGAAIATGDPTLLLTGELALLHDLGGIVAAARSEAPLGIVCLNNGGGGIFDFLPVAEHADEALYEGHIATPAAVDLRAVAALGGLEHVEAATAEAAAPGRLVEIRTDRAENVRLHRHLTAAVGAKLQVA